MAVSLEPRPRPTVKRLLQPLAGSLQIGSERTTLTRSRCRDPGASRGDRVPAPSPHRPAPQPERLAGRRPVGGADGAEHGREHQPAAHRRVRSAAPCRWRSCSRRSACCSSAWGFVRLCQYFQHAGSVYAFVGLTLGPRTGVVAGLALFATYTFYGVVTSSAAGLFMSAFLDQIDVWNNPPAWQPFIFAAVALALALLLTVVPAKRGTTTLLSIEGVDRRAHPRRLGRRAGPGHRPPRARRRLAALRPVGVHGVAGPRRLDGVPRRGVRLPVVRRLRGGVDPRRGDGEPAPRHPPRHPRHRDLRRDLLRRRHRGRDDGLRHRQGRRWPRSRASPSLLGDLGARYIGEWVGDLISLGAAISAFGCCLACVVGASRLLFAMQPRRRRRREGPRRS